MRELGIEILTDEAMKLLRMETDQLYATLGGQLLGQGVPSRVAGIVNYLSAIRSASLAGTFLEALPAKPALGEWGSGVGAIYEELKQDGMRYFSEVSEELRKALCSQDTLRLPESVTPSTMQIVVTVVRAVLPAPKEMTAISATVSATIMKLGLRNFCRRG